MQTIIGKLGTCLTTPEQEIIKQFDKKCDDMYFIAKGECAVNLKDEKDRTHIGIALLVERDHFGEVSMVYKCQRTATVVSRTYNTLARLSY